MEPRVSIANRLRARGFDSGLKTSTRVWNGEEGIRTPGTVTRTHDFQSCAFDHSATSPGDSRENHRPAAVTPGFDRRVFQPAGLPSGRFQNAAAPRAAGPSSGERGIRTHGTLAGSLDFESSAFDHSASSPRAKLAARSTLSRTGSACAERGREPQEREPPPAACARRSSRAARASGVRRRVSRVSLLRLRFVDDVDRDDA